MLWRLGRTTEAVPMLKKHLRLARRVGSRTGEANALGNLALAFADLGDIRRAIRYNRRQLTLSRSLSDKRGAANAYGNLGKAYLDL
ncbi:tetratricopeptide repeat protein, partial [Bradyrhizobium sp. USDA 3458]|uniref:tetratricopeptide repeat protein n=1 Tax=Bradyrhizobium sp. USDA 3458 TaxID=2591461 RepID=UPI00132F8373